MPERRHQYLREERGLTVREVLIHPQVPGLDAEAAQFPGGVHDLNVSAREFLARNRCER